MAERAVRSLRTRLLAWYVGTSLLVLATVGVAVCWVTWQSRVSAVDAELRVQARRVSGAVRARPGGAFDVELPSDATAYFQQARPRTYYAVWTARGRLVDQSRPDLGLPAAPVSGARTRGASREVIVGDGELTVLVGRQIDDVREELWSLAGTMALAGTGAMALALLCAWLVASRALAPVQRISETARRMAGGELSARVAVDRTESELGQVADALNLAFDRLHEALERQSRFTADASHELRTPVAMLSAEVDWVLMRERSAAEYREALEACSRVAARMRGLVQSLLILARADSGELSVSRERVRLDLVIDQAVESLRQLSLDRCVRVESAMMPVTVEGDSERLLQLVTNLVLNAVVYSPPDGLVRVALTLEGNEATVRVTDRGIGIEADDLPRIFDRFYRCTSARTCEPGGAGLGLAIAKWIVDAHHGAIACTSEPGCGTEFVVRLPAHQAAGRVPGTGPPPPAPGERAVQGLSRV